MSASKESKRWGCQFCGVVAAQEEKPVPGACREREGAPHSWMNAAILEGDPDVLAELNRKIEAANELVGQAAREALGEKFREGDAGHAATAARRLMVEGDGWQTVLLEVASQAGSVAKERSIQEWRCWRCGLPAGELAADMVEPHSGGCPVVGGGHGWRQWWTTVELDEAKDSWERHSDSHGQLRTAAAIGRYRELQQAGVGWESARAQATELDEALSRPAIVESEAENRAAAQVKAPDESNSSGPAAVEAPAKRPRGRPRKDASAQVVAAPPVSRPSPAPAEDGDEEPSRIGADDEESESPEPLRTCRDALNQIDGAIDAVETVRRWMAGSPGGHILGEAIDELLRRRGRLSRDMDRDNARARKAGAE